jgi:hypothetical protein
VLAAGFATAEAVSPKDNTMTRLLLKGANFKTVTGEELLAVEGGLNDGMLPLAVVVAVQRILAKLQ